MRLLVIPLPYIQTNLLADIPTLCRWHPWFRSGHLSFCQSLNLKDLHLSYRSYYDAGVKRYFAPRYLRIATHFKNGYFYPYFFLTNDITNGNILISNNVEGKDGAYYFKFAFIKGNDDL